jgi:beta-glucosidase/6-phospho-beta-glucosidase/beta-galactosidase
MLATGLLLVTHWRGLMRYLSGLESILCYDDGVDVAQLTRHTQRLHSDLDLVQETGLDWFRYPWRWHAIERTPGKYDWGFTDEAMLELRNRSICPIIDPCHHISIPRFLEDGFLDPEFPERYLRFVAAGAERYPWANQFTVFNEPFATTLFCGKTGFWYPYHTSDVHFVAIAINVATAVCRVSSMLSNVANFQSVHFETCEHHAGLDQRGREWASRENHMRFLITDLMLGLVRQDHPLYGFLRENGLTDDRMRWFWTHPARIDIFGLNYYVHSEIQWRGTSSGFESVQPSVAPRGFRSVARDYIDRYGRRVMLGETNIRGTIADRTNWLKYTLQECEHLAGDPDTKFLGYCWFPLWDSCSWSRDLCRTAKTEPDPVGIYMLDEPTSFRIKSSLSETFGRLVRGHWTAKDIPALPFSPEVGRWVHGYRRFFEGWRWQCDGPGDLAA